MYTAHVQSQYIILLSQLVLNPLGHPGWSDSAIHPLQYWSHIWFDKLVLESNHILNVIAIIVQVLVKIWVQCQLSTNADLSHRHWLCWIMSWNWYIWIGYHPVKSRFDLGIDGSWYLAQCVQSPPKTFERWLSHDWAYYPGGAGTCEPNQTWQLLLA